MIIFLLQKKPKMHSKIIYCIRCATNRTKQESNTKSYKAQRNAIKKVLLINTHMTLVNDSKKEVIYKIHG